MAAYPKNWPQAETGSPLFKVYRALWRAGSQYAEGQDWQCVAHDDNRASLGVREGDRSPVVLFCQAGCESSDILTALGLTWADAYFDDRGVQTMRGVSAGVTPDRNAKPRQQRTGGGSRNTAAKPTVAKHVHDANCEEVGRREWTYTDEDDRRLTTVRRVDLSCGGKKVTQPFGGRARKVLYRLADVAQQVKAGGQVVLVEGEPSVDAALSAGWETARAGRKRSMVVTTMRAGAGKPWPESHTAALKGASRVVIVSDRDLPGYQHARTVARALRAAEIPVSVVRSATTGSHDDVVEHIEAGGTFETLERVSPAALRKLATEVDAEDVAPATTGWSNKADEASTWPSPGDPRAIALYFRDQQFRDDEGRLLLKHWRGDFYTWAGSHWQMMPTNEIESLLEEQMHAAVFLKPVSVDEGQPAEWEKMPMPVNSARIRDIMHFLANIGIISEGIEPPAYLDGTNTGVRFISLGNGNLAIDGDRAGELESHTPALFNLNALPFDYDPNAKCPEWVKFLKSLWPEDAKSIRLVQQVLGYLVSGRSEQEKIIMLLGPTRSGKSTIARVIEHLMGLHNMAAPTFDSLSTQFGVQPLLGKSVAYIADARLNNRNAQSALGLIMRLSGRDATTVDRKNKDAWTGHVPARFLIVSNEAPNFNEDSTAYANRMVTVRTTESFLGREDLDLFGRLQEELPGIFNWALRGLAHLDSVGRFVRPAISVAAERDAIRMSSPITAFVQDRCEIDPRASVSKDELYGEWRAWCSINGEHERSSALFGRSLFTAFAGQVRPGRARVGVLGKDGGTQTGNRRGYTYVGIRVDESKASFR